jgi:hypothetical protein
LSIRNKLLKRAIFCMSLGMLISASTTFRAMLPLAPTSNSKHVISYSQVLAQVHVKSINKVMPALTGKYTEQTILATCHTRQIKIPWCGIFKNLLKLDPCNFISKERIFNHFCPPLKYFWFLPAALQMPWHLFIYLFIYLFMLCRVQTKSNHPQACKVFSYIFLFYLKSCLFALNIF